MKLKRPLPSDRSLEQVQTHYRVEKATAEKLKNSTSEERKLLYSTMYDELFSQVPDHPRLTRRKDEQLTLRANASKLALVRKFLDESVVFAELAPGDCRFAFEAAAYVHHVYGIDISDQRNPDDTAPDNFNLIVYDGYNLDEIEDDSVDVVFSDQLIEHLHPEDTRLHFQLMRRILKPGGKYVFRTPHSLTGPHDISKYFSDVPEGFHLKEWTYRELKKMIKELNYSAFQTYFSAKGLVLRLPYIHFAFWEMFLKLLPGRCRRCVARYMVPSIFAVAVK